MTFIWNQRFKSEVFIESLKYLFFYSFCGTDWHYSASLLTKRLTISPVDTGNAT